MGKQFEEQKQVAEHTYMNYGVKVQANEFQR
jgi:hypothetical protein